MISEAQFELLNLFTADFDSQQPAHSTKNDTDYVLQSIWTILHDQPKLVEHALEVLDQCGRSIHSQLNQSNTFNSVIGVGVGGNKSIRQVVDPTGRYFFLVNGSQHQEYFCLNNFCSCQNFSQLSLLQQLDGRKLICKHLLAVRIGLALDMIDVCSCSFENFLTAFLANSTVA